MGERKGRGREIPERVGGEENGERCDKREGGREREKKGSQVIKWNINNKVTSFKEITYLESLTLLNAQNKLQWQCKMVKTKWSIYTTNQK